MYISVNQTKNLVFIGTECIIGIPSELIPSILISQEPATGGYSTFYAQTGNVRNRGVELSLGYKNTWNKFTWNTNYTFSANKNKILSLIDGYVHPVTGEVVSKSQLDMKGLSHAHFILREGGSLGDLYSMSDLMRDANNNIYVDADGAVKKENLNDGIKLGSVFPKANMAWRNDMIKGIDDMLSRGISFSLYMTHGGTNWGHWAGANSPGFAPDVTSYDYDAPISESGQTTPKYWALREAMAKYMDGEKQAKVPALIKPISIPAFRFTEMAPLFENLPAAKKDENIRTMEEYNQGFGKNGLRSVRASK